MGVYNKINKEYALERSIEHMGWHFRYRFKSSCGAATFYFNRLEELAEYLYVLNEAWEPSLISWENEKEVLADGEAIGYTKRMK